ncbi:MAG: TetR/AcrR family transcriptional regulator [Betaproteobacteria bacterium]|nr:TetR/AcrR family transcriptional regulator [Betaproteobacteria bacterium]
MARVAASAPSTRRREEEIIAAAAQVFARRGYHGASTQDIADVLGMRQASLYYYFPSKEKALKLVCERGVAGYAEGAAAVAAGGARATAKLTALLRNHLEPMRERAAYVHVFQRERRYLPPDLRPRVRRLARRYEKIVEQVFAQGARSGEFRRDLDCRMAALALIGMCNAATAWYGLEPGASLERIVRNYARFMIEGVAAKPAPRAR